MKTIELGGGSNPIIECACGCGQRLAKFKCDYKNGHYRPRRFINGHRIRMYSKENHPSRTLKAREINRTAKLGDKNPMKRPEVRAKSSLSHRGKSSGRKGKKNTEAHIAKSNITRILNNKLPDHYTCLEQIYREYLLRGGLIEGVDFYHNFQLGRYYVDFLIVGRELIVETDGIMHKYDGTKRVVRDAYLQRLGFRVIHYDLEQTKRFQKMEV